MVDEEGQKKFDTCRHRSNTIETYGERWCCGENTRDGYICYELNILDLIPDLCKLCSKYEPRPSNG